jgi:tetratricopeptide (TPR) repeat protein
LFEEIGKHRPLIVAFDDVHWAEPALLDLLEHVGNWSRAGALLLLCMARPDLLDLRPDWGGGKYNATTILLEPLNEDESKRLITQLLGGDPPTEVLDRIVSAAEGNPLFLEEMLSMLIDDDLLRRTNGQWVLGDLSKVSIPPSIHALIAARLELLDRKERVVIERAAVVGKEFDLRSVANLIPGDSSIDVAACVTALVRKDLLRPSESDPTGKVYRFRHLLIQDAAYRGIPKEVRAELHHKFAEWFERESASLMREYEEIVGHHYEQAARFLQELGIADERVETLRRRAAERLGSAGVRAYARADSSAAETLLAKAIDLLPAQEARRMELLPFLGAAKGDRSDLAGAENAYREAIELAGRHGREDVRRHGEIALEHLRLATAPLGIDLDHVLRKAHEAIAALDGSGNNLALALAWFLVVVANHRLGKFTVAGEAAGRALAHARSARQPRQEADACGLVMVSGLLGSLPLTEMVELAEQMLQQAGGNQMLELWATGELGVAEILLGREHDGRAKISLARERLEELGLEFGIAAVDAMQADCELPLANLHEAERLYREAFELLLKIGDEAGASAVAGALARACLLHGDLEEAERYTAESERGIPERALHFRSRWRAPRALLLARRGEIQEAKRVAREWQGYIDTTDALMHRGDAWMDLAEILRLEEETAGARRAAERALSLYARKKDKCDSDRAHRFLVGLSVD